VCYFPPRGNRWRARARRSGAAAEVPPPLPVSRCREPPLTFPPGLPKLGEALRVLGLNGSSLPLSQVLTAEL